MKYLYLLILLVGMVPAVYSEELKAVGNVFVRELPPSGLFCSKGEDLGVINTGEKVKLIREVSAVCGLFFSYKFFLIEYTDKNGNKIDAYVSSLDSNGRELFERGM